MPWLRTALVALGLTTLAGFAASDDKVGNLPDPHAAQGRAQFRAAVRWLRADSPPLETVQRVRVDLQDVTVKGKGKGTHDGHSRIWLDLPDRFRWEMRTVRNAPKARRRVKVLDGQRAWQYLPPGSGHPRGTWKRMHGDPNNPGAVAQLQKDRDVFAGLARYLTLQGLDGKGVTFRDEGIVSFAQGHHLEGRWLKLRRTGPQGARMAFLFAFEPGSAPGAQTPREPRAVLIPADKARGTETEHIVLSGWRLVRGRRVPLRVLRYTRDAQGHLRWTLRARIADLALNPTLPAALFAPPPPKAAAGSTGR